MHVSDHVYTIYHNIDRALAMASLYKYYQSLPMSKEAGLNEVATKEANASVEKVLEELGNGSEKGKKRLKYRYSIMTSIVLFIHLFALSLLNSIIIQTP